MRSKTYHMVVCGMLGCVAVFVSLPSVVASSKKEPLDLQIAKYSAIIGSNRLNKNITDEKGLLLLRLCGVLNRKDETYLFTCNLLRKQMKPDIIASHVDETKLLSVMQSRILKLHKSLYPKNKKVAKLIILYGKVLEQFKPREKDVLVTLESLAQDGVGGTLDELLATTIDIKELFAVDTVSTPAASISAAVAPGKAVENGVVVADDIDLRIDLPADKTEFEKYFVLDEKVEIREGSIFFKKKKKEFKHETVVFPKRGGGIRTKCAFVGDFTFSFRGQFDRLNLTTCGRTVRLSSSKLEGVTKFQVVRQGNTLTINGGKRASSKLYDFEIVGEARSKPSTLSIDSRYAKEDGWIRTFRVVGKGIWEKK